MRNFSSILTRSAPRPRPVILSAEPPIRSRRRVWLLRFLAAVCSIAAHIGVASAILAWPRDLSERPLTVVPVVAAQLVLEVAEPRAPLEEPTARQGDAPAAAIVPDMEVAEIVVETPPEPPVEVATADVAINATPSAAALPDPDPLPLPDPEPIQEAAVRPPNFARPPPMRVLSTILPYRDRALIEGRIRAEWTRQRVARGLTRGPRVELELEVNLSLDGRLIHARVMNAAALVERLPTLEPWIESLLAAARDAAPFRTTFVIAPSIVRFQDERTEVVLWRFWLVAR